MHIVLELGSAAPDVLVLASRAPRRLRGQWTQSSSCVRDLAEARSVVSLQVTRRRHQILREGLYTDRGGSLTYGDSPARRAVHPKWMCSLPLACSARAVARRRTLATMGLRGRSLASEELLEQRGPLSVPIASRAALRARHRDRTPWPLEARHLLHYVMTRFQSMTWPAAWSSLASSMRHAPLASMPVHTTPAKSLGISTSPFLKVHTFSRPSRAMK